SAGNESGEDAVNDTSINAPADGDSVLAVGAVDSLGHRAYFSSQGPTADGRIKPDVVARGMHTAIAAVTNDTEYVTGSGTSFSCPLVAGVVALMLEANPNLLPMDIIRILHETSSQANQPDNSLGWGLVDAEAAVLRALDMIAVVEPGEGANPRFFTLSSVWPNPTNGFIRLRLQTREGGSAELALFDLLGRQVMRRSVMIVAGVNSLDLSLDGIASGVYLIRVTQRGETQSRKIVLVR
ncbi:MAG: S8/S53 family peptidase, partial [bacterium]